MLRSGWEEGCLPCLLRTGFGGEGDEIFALPNETSRKRYQHYEILNRRDGSRWELGRGTMGVTFKARDVNLDTVVALKVISPRYSAWPAARLLFLREAQAAAGLRHPHVASVFHFGTVPAAPVISGAETGADEGECFYVTEFVDGESLQDRLRRSGPLAPLEALEVARQVGRALLAAGKKGLVHGDLKPSNIMLSAGEDYLAGSARSPGTAGPWVKIIDFGLAKVEAEAEAGLLTSVSFASPEQKAGDKIDARSDIYSLGATLWYAVSGELAADGAQGEPPLLDPLRERKVPICLSRLLQTMLAYRPEDRPATAFTLNAALDDCLRQMTGGGRPTWLGRGGRASAPIVMGVAAVLIALAIFLLPARDKTNPKSLAVLPFRNLSVDPANAFLAEGVQDDILSRLVKIRDLKVIGRAGTAVYPANAPRDLGAIGRALGVRHLLEGSLRREGNRVRLHLSLIDTRDGHEVWSEGYDRALADAIHLQGELAGEIAAALNATLSPKEKRSVLSRPTGNSDAYVLFLRGRKFEKSPGFAISDFEQAEVFYKQAVAVDPQFALAHAHLAMTLELLYCFRGPNENLQREAWRETTEAIRLRPDLGEASLARGLYFYRIERDFERAVPDLQMAQRLLPGDTEAEATMAFIQRRQGKWKRARSGQERVLQREPFDKLYEHELYATATLLRDWPAAIHHIERAMALAPGMTPFRAERSLAVLWQSGNLEPLQQFLEHLPAYGDPEGNVAWARWDCAMLARDFPAARRGLERFPNPALPSVLSAPVAKAYLEGCAWLAQGDQTRAQERFEVARPAMEAAAVAHPDDSLRHARLGLLYAYMGRKEDALQEGGRAVRLVPVTKDAIEGHFRLCNLALIHARVGDRDRALAMIEHLLREPGCVSPLDEASMSLWDLRLRWQWDPLRSDPHFQEILAAPEPATVY